jgi:prepilin-type N-terminal cleavage/methylation domain-containing protein
MGDQKGTGFTLLELLVAVALASLVLVSLSFITQTMFTAKRDLESYDAERDMFRAEFLVRSALSTAVDVRKVDSAQTGGRGWVNTSFAVPDGADIQPVAVFRREVRAFPLPPTVPGATGDTTSLHVNSGIFYIPPRFADGVYTSGVLFVNFGSEANPTAPVSPSYANEVVANLVRFETSKPQFIPAAEHPDNLDILKGFEVELIFRRFVNQSMVRPKCFLSTAGACP